MFFRNFPKTTYDYLGNGVDSIIHDIFRFVKPIDHFRDELDTYQFYQISEGDRPDVVSQKLYDTPEYYWTFFVINDNLRGGLSSWPLSSEELEKYLDDIYSGTVITTVPRYVYDTDGILRDIKNSLAGRFQIGETVVGQQSGATGVVRSKDATMGQLVLDNVVGNFISPELIVGSLSEDVIASFDVLDEVDAPKYYTDANGRPVTNNLYAPLADPVNYMEIVTNREYEMDLNEQKSKIRVIKRSHILAFAEAYEDLIKR